MHLDMDAFFASVEQAINPKLRGRPVIVGSRRKKYMTVVAACSYEAKAYGIESGMSSAEALARCPRAVFVPCDSSRYMYTSDRIAAMLRGCSDRMERASIDEFNLDLTATGSAAAAAEVAARVRRRIREEFSITGSAGIAPSRTIAKIAAKSCKPDGLRVVPPEEVTGFLAGMPVEKVPGIGVHLKQYLNEMCVFTIGELACVSPERLVRRFGKTGLWMHRVIRGLGDDTIPLWSEPSPPPKSVGHSYTLEREVRRLADVEAWIRMLAEMVGARLRSCGLESRVAHLYLQGRAGFYSRERTFHDYTSDSAEITARAMLILKSFRLHAVSMRGLGVSVSRLVPAQELRLLQEDEKRRRLTEAVDRVNGRFGEWAICPAVVKSIVSA